MMSGEAGYARAEVASADEIFAWIEEIYAFGAADRYGYRMPGTASDHATARYLESKLRGFGLADVRLEPVPIAVAFPDDWSLSVSGESRIPCGFVRYAAYTSPEGITAPLAYLGEGMPEDFDRIDVTGRIVVVDLVVDGIVPPMGETFFVHDPRGIIADQQGCAAWPLRNLVSSFEEAHRRGAAGWVGILTVFGDDTNEYLHWYAKFELPGLTVSSASGIRLRELARAGADATLVLTGTRGQGVAFNVYGVIPGRSNDEYIVLKSHYDGWATNEASGAAVTLATAAALARQNEPLDRSVLVFFRASHFGVSWSLGPDSWHVPRESAASIYGLRKDWSDYECLAVELIPRTVVVNNIEMIGRLYRHEDGKWIATDDPSVRYWGVTGPVGGANPVLLNIVSSAILRYDLTGSQVSNFLVGDGWDYIRHAVPLVNFISHNIWQFTARDTPETVLRVDLPKAAGAFVDIIRAEDRERSESLRPATVVQFAIQPGGRFSQSD